MKNILVPKHEVLSAEEAERVLQNYNVTREEMPKIKIHDPGIKGLNAKVGDIIKITRNSPTAGEAIYYRVVIE
ncbi:MAG: DNA-directed RNA polymerase subunit H [Candidatus Altiarchaeota archaeon]